MAHPLNHIEGQLTQARQKDHGKTGVEQTDNLIVATFRHETARPTPDSPHDPNLHTHAFIMNATQRKDDGTWVALSNEQIVKLRKLQDAVYMAELDKHVRELGYGVRYEKNHIELAHVTREQIDVFSKRSAQVVSALAERGKERASASHAQRQMLTLATREQKSAELSRDELFRHWAVQAREAVTLAATGRASESLKLLDDVVCIPDAITTDEHGCQTRDGKDRYDAIAGEYANLTQYEQAKTLIVTGTNASRQAINDRVHELLGLKGRGSTYTLLTRRDTTRAERRCAKYYTVGDIIQPERDYRCSLQRGQLYQVVQRDEHTSRPRRATFPRVRCSYHFAHTKLPTLRAGGVNTPLQSPPRLAWRGP